MSDGSSSWEGPSHPVPKLLLWQQPSRPQCFKKKGHSPKFVIHPESIHWLNTRLGGPPGISCGSGTEPMAGPVSRRRILPNDGELVPFRQTATRNRIPLDIVASAPNRTCSADATTYATDGCFNNAAVTTGHLRGRLVRLDVPKFLSVAFSITGKSPTTGAFSSDDPGSPSQQPLAGVIIGTRRVTRI